jgi:hypothetical protein
VLKLRARRGHDSVAQVYNPIKAGNMKFEDGNFYFPLELDTWARLRKEMKLGEDYNKLLRRVIKHNLRYFRDEEAAVGRLIKSIQEPKPWSLK